MRKVVVAGLVLGLVLCTVSAANADPLSDWLMSLFGFSPTQGDPAGTNGQMTGGGDGSGTVS